MKKFCFVFFTSLSSWEIPKLFPDIIEKISRLITLSNFGVKAARTSWHRTLFTQRHAKSSRNYNNFHFCNKLCELAVLGKHSHRPKVAPDFRERLLSLDMFCLSGLLQLSSPRQKFSLPLSLDPFTRPKVSFVTNPETIRSRIPGLPPL